MRHHLFGHLVGALCLCLISATGLRGQVARIPVSLALAAPSPEVEAGQVVTLDVSLKNYRNEPVPALADLPVTVRLTGLEQVLRLVIPKGQTSGALRITPPGSGLFRLNATAPDVAGKSLLLVVKPEVKPELKPPSPPPPAREGSAPSRPSGALEKRRTRTADETRAPSGDRPLTSPTIATRQPAPVRVGGSIKPPTPLKPVPAPETSTPPTSAAAPSATAASRGPLPADLPPAPPLVPAKLALEAVTEEVYPEGGNWRTELVVVLLTADDRLAPAAGEVRVQFSARIGRLSPSEILIPPGAHASQPISLVSTSSGSDVIRVRSSLGTTETKVIYQVPRPARFRIEAYPREAVNSGRTPIITTVLLLDQSDRPTSFVDRDLDVVFSSSLGAIMPRQTKIPTKEFWAEATLTSASHGEARVAVNGLGFPEATTTVQFFFPWLLVTFAGTGGALGAFVRSRRVSLSKEWLSSLLRNLAVGVILGLVFYTLALFGAVAVIPRAELPVAVEAVPTVNELGALLLGFVGGYYGRRLWKPRAR